MLNGAETQKEAINWVQQECHNKTNTQTKRQTHTHLSYSDQRIRICFFTATTAFSL